MICWRNQQQHQLQFPSMSNIEPISNDYFQPCQAHSKQIFFICKQEQCRDDNNSMVCNQCLASHKTHNWITKQQFLTPNIKSILSYQTTQTDQILQDSLSKITKHISLIQQQIKSQFTIIKKQLQTSILNAQDKYRFKVDKSFGSNKVIINKVKLQKLLNIYQIEQSKFEWIRIMQQNIIKISDKINQSFNCLLHDLLNIANAQKWQKRQNHADEFRQFQKHLHQHNTSDDRYYRFSEIQKHMNVQLNKENNQVVYIRSVPSKPFALSTEYVSQVHNKFGFQIIKMDSKAIFFDSTIIFIGICSANIVKSFGYRKANEFGKGTYLINSEGWAYHSTHQNFCNKQIVGWGFGQGDIITIEIIFDTQCIIRFIKKSRFFSNTFQMPLKLNEFQMNSLKPCVGFDSEEGAIVKIFDIENIQLSSV